ncbi:MAG: protecting protein DprA protein [Candidatus Falkowbacteria bacterium GW2011_GWC2_38_22]|uniref:Protecting protein DprA protein n=1 Tax=Candidatus Falkowbacteria bacterium GW2011_GWE1_38_31 TaxID=1618638 RepID=A0A0G0K6Z2_9BACT|nr:MAG: protecting protein DprA protein [Candidatus Falkowbacteria bacterium GW2011_GWF2_38_1205]KKQ61806.1 MAG: protecting protein DprA protein [Candidatus Falkowbacteria bacterium GW2011_GWC2_38_22]KKQ64114.1 MAG: protecting protein DprA protein [Candidatus Falkowbacteria bacterium GW2011_GWF1_38_22]KKQ66536.1 MAG: protecting protein DprA protein [Candidatus Falkowbacteria bacterium GW2011_GWE2_38_254]KKQ71220.1 MAG: protecting protein DprA protein [Candidatus Falkowbacteria bacterium GW2011_
MNHNEILYLIALHHFPKFGPQRILRLQKYFSSLENAFKASAQELQKAKIEENIANEFVSARININPQALFEKIQKENIKILTLESENYPRLLKEIYAPPPLLYYKGKLEKNSDFNVAIVGSRKHSSYGKLAAESISGELALNGLTIVSGLALGIDTLAHNACLSAGGTTIAVLGTGIDRQSVYPTSNRYLADKIVAENGAVISEFPLGTLPLRHNFPQRNRIISGLSLATIVIEAGEKSGALITAAFACEQNRDVFAVPGSIFSPASAGPNNLIKQGAKPISSAADIMEALSLKNISTYIDNKKIIGETTEEEIILKNLDHEARYIDELIRLTGLNASVISGTLTIMEMKGMVKNLGGMQYVLAR